MSLVTTVVGTELITATRWGLSRHAHRRPERGRP